MKLHSVCFAGKVAEGIDFDRHYGRCVIIFGIPYQYTLSHVLRARLNYMRERYNIRDNDFLTFDALRQSAQCVGRVIRSKTDYGVVILADSRYNRADKRSKFPPWILQFLKESSMNLPTDGAVDQIKTFLRLMGQPVDQESLHSILLNEAQVSSMFHVHKLPGTADALLQHQLLQKSVPGGAAVESSTMDVDRGGAMGACEGSSCVEVVDVLEVVGEQQGEESEGSASEYNKMDVVVEGGLVDTSKSSVAAAVDAGGAGGVSENNKVTAAVGNVRGGRRSVVGHSKSLFLFEDILDASDTDE